MRIGVRERHHLRTRQLAAPMAIDGSGIVSLVLLYHCNCSTVVRVRTSMDPAAPGLSSTFPLPPMSYIELFSDDNIHQNPAILQPPPPIEVNLFMKNECVFDHCRCGNRARTNYSVKSSPESIIPNRSFGRWNRLAFSAFTNVRMITRAN